jgi:hypothetical protein
VSLNLGNDGMIACQNLANSSDFILFRDALLDKAREQMNAALDIEPTKRDDAVGYARALRDLWLAIEGAVSGQRMNQVKKPGAIDPRAASTAQAAVGAR